MHNYKAKHKSMHDYKIYKLTKRAFLTNVQCKCPFLNKNLFFVCGYVNVDQTKFIAGSCFPFRNRFLKHQAVHLILITPYIQICGKRTGNLCCYGMKLCDNSDLQFQYWGKRYIWKLMTGRQYLVIEVVPCN